MPATATAPAPRLNNQGLPCTSKGRRNAAAIGTNRGNGGVMPPGHYTRRRDVVRRENRHGRRFREQWRRVIDHLLAVGDIHRTVHAVASALSTHSSDTGKNAWPSHATLADQVGVSASTVCRALAELRAIGLVEWDHQFRQVDGKPRATSNLYEFRIPPPLGRVVNVDQRSMYRDRTPPAHVTAKRAPDWQRDIDSHVHAIAQVSTDYMTAEAQLFNDFNGRSTEQLTFAAHALNEAWRHHRRE